MGEEEHNKEESTEDISISEDNSKHEAEQTKEEVSEKQSFSDDAQKSSISDKTKEIEEEHKEEHKEEQKTEQEQEPKQEIKEEISEKQSFSDDAQKSSISDKEKKPFLQTIKQFYEKDYKKLLVIPFALLLIALILTSIQIATTGDFVEKDVSLKGGITITIITDKQIDIKDLENYLDNEFPESDLSVRSLKQVGSSIGIIIDGTEDLESEDIIDSLTSKIGKIEKDNYTVSKMGSSLGASFFKETLKAIFISFLFMGIVIFWYFGENIKIKILATALTVLAAALMFFGTPSIIKDISAYLIGAALLTTYIKNSMPSFMVILNVFSDVLVTLAVINLLGIKLSTAGIAAFLMIIGYSVDTNILLSVKLLKRKEGEVIDRLLNAMKTGMTMTLTTSAAIIVAFIFTQSSVIKQIMLILFIGLMVDMIYTWLQNAGILRIYLEKKKDEYKN